MNRSVLGVCALAAALTLSACATGHGGGYAYNDGPADVWYDGYYGDYAGGYWGPDAFYYRDHDGHFNRDAGGHFRHETFSGARGMHAERPPGDVR